MTGYTIKGQANLLLEFQELRISNAIHSKQEYCLNNWLRFPIKWQAGLVSELLTGCIIKGQANLLFEFQGSRISNAMHGK